MTNGSLNYELLFTHGRIRGLKKIFPLKESNKSHQWGHDVRQGMVKSFYHGENKNINKSSEFSDPQDPVHILLSLQTWTDVRKITTTKRLINLDFLQVLAKKWSLVSHIVSVRPYFESKNNTIQ